MMVRKKKIIFILIYAPALDGIGRALLGYLSSIDFSRNEVHLGFFNREGPLRSHLPQGIVYHHISGFHQIFPPPSKQAIQECIKKKDWISAIREGILLIECKLDGSSRPYYRFLFKNVKVPDCLFDEAHAFHAPWSIIDYCICEKIKAIVKFGWIHVDVSRMPIEESLIKRLYRKYKTIFVVSKEAQFIFNNRFPQFKKRTQVRIHQIDKEMIMDRAMNGATFTDGFEGKKILTVGRISSEKGQQDAILAIPEIIKHRTDIKWYFIGEGEDIDCCKHLCQELGVQDFVVFLGFIENPFRYMKDCDLYVQPSRHEGFCLSLAEALCFDKPVIATPFSGAKEQLEGRSGAKIVGVDTDTLSHGILELLSWQDE